MGELKALVVTQKVDKNDDILGFFSKWLNELAKRLDKIYVLALEIGKIDLVRNVELHSLGKGCNNNRLRRVLKFNQILLNLCLTNKIDIIFIHMCPEYALLAFPYAKIMKIPMVMWYAHGATNMKLKIAHLLVNKVITPSKESFKIKSGKIIITGHGIDVDKFHPNLTDNLDIFSDEGLKEIDKIQNNENKIILSVGRISPIKNYETLIMAAEALIKYRNIRNLRFQIVGDIPIKSQKGYLVFLKNMVKKYKLEDYVQFIGPVSYTQIHNYYQNCDLFVSTSNTGSLDKAILEAMACGKVILTCNEALSSILDGYSDKLMFENGNIYVLAEKIISLLDMSPQSYQELGHELRNIVVERHSLDELAGKIEEVFNGLT